MKKIKLLSLMLLLLPLTPVKADEGMWLLPLLEKMNSGRMTELGFEITPQEIYDLNNTTLKDAIVIFGNGCTGEIVSDQDLSSPITTAVMRPSSSSAPLSTTI